MIERAKMRAASQTFKLLFWDTLQTRGVMTPAVQEALLMLMEIGVTDWKALYTWFMGLPLMRQWINDRQASVLEADGFEVTQIPYESTLKVITDDIKFDRLGGYRPHIQRMANEMMLLKYRELIKLIQDARAGTIYGNAFDGYPLISASHLTGTNSGTAALAAASLDDAIDAMKAQHDITSGDDRLLVEPTHLWYHPTLRSTVHSLLEMKYVAGLGSSTTHVDTMIENPHYGVLKALELPMGSAYAAYWGLFAASPGQDMGAVLWQFDPAGGKFVAMDSETSEGVFWRREAYFGTELWGAIAPGFPQQIWGSDGTT